MICPNCQAENDSFASTCHACGAPLEQAGRAASPEAVKAVTTTGLVLGKKARELRLNTPVDPHALISARAYNGTIAVVLLWGLLVNYLLCEFVGTSIFTVNPIVLLVGYLVLVLAGTVIAAKSSNPLASFLGYNMVVVPLGLVISYVVDAFGGMHSA